MIEQIHTSSEEYQKEVAAQYEARVAKFTPTHVLEAIESLGVPDAPAIEDISEAAAGNAHATYVTPELVIKLNQNREHPDYVANKIVSDAMGDTWPVVKVLAYDDFEKTDFETLVMRRSEGVMLLDMVEMNEQDRAAVFKQILEVVKRLFEIKFNDFGWINLDGKESFPTYAEFLKHEFSKHMVKIKAEQLASPEDIEKIETYFNQHIQVFDDEPSVFVHTDIHMGNVLHQDDRLTAVLDFDGSQKAPKERVLISLLGLIDNPSQFVEGTNDFPKYKGKNFYHLLPILRNEFPDMFSDPQLSRKLNLIGLNEGMMWVSQNWSSAWNKDQLAWIIAHELPAEDLSNTYHGKILAH